MKKKVHYVVTLAQNPNLDKLCGRPFAEGSLYTNNIADVTCDVCRYRWLTRQAPWAEEFLANLRGALVAEKRSAGAARSVSVPGGTAKPMNGQEKRLGRTLAGLLDQEGIAQETVCEFLTVPAPTLRTVQPVMDHGGTSAEPIRVQPGEVAKEPGNAG